MITMKNDEIEIKELDYNNIIGISTTERHYGEFKIKLKLDDNKWYTLIRKGNHHTTRLFNETYTQRMVDKYGERNQKLGYTFIHDPRLWEEPIEDEW